MQLTSRPSLNPTRRTRHREYLLGREFLLFRSPRMRLPPSAKLFNLEHFSWEAGEGPLARKPVGLLPICAISKERIIEVVGSPRAYSPFSPALRSRPSKNSFSHFILRASSSDGGRNSAASRVAPFGSRLARRGRRLFCFFCFARDICAEDPTPALHRTTRLIDQPTELLYKWTREYRRAC
jgi:hypothetical protein